MPAEFHFLRPYWFFAIIPLVLLLWILAKHHLSNKHWESICDPELLPYILVGQTEAKKYTPVFLVGFISLFMIIALAGPVWERLPEPVFAKETALVMALDLSLSMYADDIKPSRLERACFKISDLLDLRREGQTALIVYAGDAFTVTPLTNDIKTIKSQLTALTPDIMPAPGSNADSAIEKAIALLKQAGHRAGHIMLVTDAVDSRFDSDFYKANRRGYKVSILGIGTEAGAPVKLANGGFLKDRAGAIVIPRLNQTVLRQLANTSGGYYVTSQLDDGDIERLNHFFYSGLEKAEDTESAFKTDQWREFGPWLLLPLLPLVAFGFRRGYLVLFMCLLMQSPDEAMAFEWDDLWLNKNQRAMRALENGQPELAAELFDDKKWKAVAHYRKGDYAAAARLLDEHADIRSLYNKANALAQQGRYEEAIAAYDEVLAHDPKHEDAIFNRDLTQQVLEAQEQQQSNADQNAAEQSAQQDQNADSEQQPSAAEQPSTQESEQQAHTEQQAEANEDAEPPSKQTAKTQQAQEASSAAQTPAKTSQQTSTELDETQQATEQWLRRIPDDPAGLLRRKFKYQYQQQDRPATTEKQYW